MPPVELRGVRPIPISLASGTLPRRADQRVCPKPRPIAADGVWVTWNAAVGVLFAALPVAPSQELPPPTVPPVTVTVPLPGPVTDTTVDGSVSVSVSADLPLPTSDESTGTQQTAPADDPTSAQTPTSPSTIPGATDDPGAVEGAVEGAATPRPAPDRRPGDPNGPRRRQPGSAPLLRQPRTQLLGAASDAAGEFAPAGAVAALVGLALVTDGLIRRRDDLAHIRLDDRDAVVRFE